MTCPFCELPRDRVVAESALTVTIRDGYPVSPGHTLVIPKRHVASLTETTRDEQLALLDAIAAARASLDAELHPDGYNLGVNDGVAAGQTVMHLHVHLIPRFAGDVPNPRGGVRHCLPGKGCSCPASEE
jgi:diadenosine tetraphosphate (Ap4A) HIT family hydrolase